MINNNNNNNNNAATDCYILYKKQGYIHAGLIGHAPVLRQFVYKSWLCATFTLNLATFVPHTFTGLLTGMELTPNPP